MTSAAKQAAVEEVVEVLIDDTLANLRWWQSVGSNVEDRPEALLPAHLLPEGWIVVGAGLRA